MNKFVAIALVAATFAGVTAASARGKLDAPEPIVRNYAIHVNIEPGYISKDDILHDIRSGARSER